VRRPVRLLIAAAAALAAVAGCSDPGPTDIDATEAVFLETCAPGGTPLEERVCRCAFDAITEDLSASGLERLDRNLRDDPDTVPPEVTEAALACAAAPLTPPTARPTTSTTSTTPPDEDEGDDETTTTLDPDDETTTTLDPDDETTTTERDP
jgi:hypothetical protein